MRAHRVCLAVLGAALLAAGPAFAQIRVHGVLLDAASNAPIPSARVALTGTGGQWRGEILTDSVGAFAFPDVRPGTYRLRTTRVGYRESRGALRLAADSIVQLELKMAVARVELEPVTVVARSRRSVSPVLEGFYARMERGQGRFVTREEINARRPGRVTDMLRGIPNITANTSRQGTGGGTITRGSSGDRCTVVVWVDGMLVSQPSAMGTATGTSAFRSPRGGGGGGPREDQSIDDYVHPNDVEGIEVYRGESDTPAEFITRWVSCGTVVIWTRRGEPRRG
ncbi:MAG TPA: carboxypeptidase regulatory-like domain-containing protein [Longimicrobium sp.]